MRLISKCLFCGNPSSKATVFPTNHFNGKTFRYIRCTECDLVYLDPLPTEADYVAMYPSEYQHNTVETDVLQNPYCKLFGLRFSYGFQYDCIRKTLGSNPIRILDYGCGTGHFVANASAAGFHCDGAEYNPGMIDLLTKELPLSRFYLVSQLLETKNHEKYDVIRLSNVLEHLAEPTKVLLILQKMLNHEGIFLVEGPIEENASLATTFRKSYMHLVKLLRPRKTVSAPPYHTLLSNASNQREFFSKSCGFEEKIFRLSEAAWPLPEKLSKAKTVFQAVGFFVARFSIFLSRFFPRLGNTFLYVGKASSSD